MNLLLEQENITNSLRDGQGETCREVAKGKEAVWAIDGMYVVILIESVWTILDSRSFLNASYGSLLQTYILSRIARERWHMRWLERTIMSACSCTTVSRFISLVKAHTNKFPVANHDKTLLPNPTPPSEPLKSYLNKCTNVAKGYNTRWFVLKG